MRQKSKFQRKESSSVAIANNKLNHLNINLPKNTLAGDTVKNSPSTISPDTMRAPNPHYMAQHHSKKPDQFPHFTSTKTKPKHDNKKP